MQWQQTIVLKHSAFSDAYGSFEMEQTTNNYYSPTNVIYSYFIFQIQTLNSPVQKSKSFMDIELY